MNIQNIQRKFPLIVAIGCGILAVALLNIYLKQKEERIWVKMKEVMKQQQGGGGGIGAVASVEKMGVVLVAKRNILPQTLIKAEDIAIKQVPEKYIQPGAVASIDKVIGKVVTSPVLEKEQLLNTKLQEPGRVGKSLSEITPKGRRAMTINVDSLSTINGFLRPGDYVDVLVTLNAKSTPDDEKISAEKYTIPFLQGIEVLAVGTESVSRSEVPGAEKKEKADITAQRIIAGTVTLGLTLQETLLLSYIQDHGKIKLVLHAADDKQGVIASPVNEEALLRYLHPELMEEWHPTVPSSAIEVYRGLNKEFMPLSKEKKE